MFTCNTILSQTSPQPLPLLQQPNHVTCQSRRVVRVTRCVSDPTAAAAGGGDANLKVGSPIIIIEAPPMLKTASSMPTLRVNSGLVKPGDVGRIVARKPKNVWAVRLAIGTYLIDGKHFKPLDIEE